MSKIFDKNMLNLFLSTALERHMIYIKKSSGAKKPWTEDIIFRKYFFCNVFRQYDKCTEWIIKKVLPFQKWELNILYRFISTYDLFKEIEENTPLSDMTGVFNFLKNKKQKGEKLFTGCFIRNPKTSIGYVDTYMVPFYTIQDIRKDGRIDEVIKQNSLQLLVEYLCKFTGIGGFMAYEYACDLEYTDSFIPEDKYTWANMGPGARRGMSLLLYGHPNKKINQDLWLQKAGHLWEMMVEVLKGYFPYEDITMREVEHWLCEFQKYCKYKKMEEEGVRAKHRKYNGGQLCTIKS